MLFECCVDSVESALIAEKGGATRVELCSSLVEGGITPSEGLIASVVKRVKIPVFVLIRCRPGDFCYHGHEIEVMRVDIETAKRNGAKGVVIGALKTDGTVDLELTKAFVECANPMEVTFHRAIDVCVDPLQGVRALCSLGGITRILSSGCAADAESGIPMLKDMVSQVQGTSTSILAGGGVTELNVEKIIHETGVKEVHGSLRVVKPSPMVYRPDPPVFMGGEKRNDAETEFTTKIADLHRIQTLVQKIFKK